MQAGHGSCRMKKQLMTTREKVIIGATVVAVLSAGISFIPGSRKNPSGSKRMPPAEDLPALVSQSRAQLAGIQLSEGERAVLDSARSAWDGEPFEVFAGLTAVNADGGGTPTHFYTGFVQADGVCFAIINGREYRVNEPLSDGAGVVNSIAPDHVVLRVGNGNLLRTIHFKNLGETKE